MKCCNGSPRAVRFFAIARHDQSGPAIALDHPGCRDANDATMPAVAVDHHAVSFPQGGIFRETLLDGIDNSAFLLLALAVELVETLGNVFRAGSVFCAEEIDYLAGDVHTASSIDTWRNAKRDFSGAERLAAE